MAPERLEEATRIFQTEVIPMLKQEGSRGVYLLVDPQSGRGLSLTLWENEADRTRYEQSGKFQEILGKFAGMLQGEPTVETYEVRAHG